MRLTKYQPSDESMFPYRLKDEELSTELDSIHKLGQLEDIEDELGIDLVTFAKILKQGFYYKDGFGNIEHFNKQMIDLVVLPKIKELGNDFEDYGKTWALTKEELEK